MKKSLLLLMLLPILIPMKSWAADVYADDSINSAVRFAGKGMIAITVPYTVLSDNTLTFYYDNKRNSREGTVYNINESYTEAPLWCTKEVKNVAFDSSFATYNVTSTAYWFSGCTNLTTIEDIRHVNTENVTDMRGMFKDCSSLTDIDLSSFNTAKVEYMNVMFSGCTALTDLNLQNFNTANVKNTGSMFKNCSSLRTLNLCNFDTRNVELMGSMFYGCSSLSALDLSSFNTANVYNMLNMFAYCNFLTTIYVSDTWSTAKIPGTGSGSSLFTSCERLVGGKYTKYDSGKINYTYAKVDGGTTDPGYFTYLNPKGEKHQAIDLGLSVNWAICNVGADAPEEYGDWLSFGELEAKTTYAASNYYFNSPENIEYWKSQDASYVALPIPYDICGTMFDAAHVRWKNGWRMPTQAELDELVSKCKYQWTKQNGVQGTLVTGPNGKTIFLPAAGYGSASFTAGSSDVGKRGIFWSGTHQTAASEAYNHWNDASTLTCAMYAFDVSGHGSQRGYDWCGNGMSIRPVRDKSYPEEMEPAPYAVLKDSVITFYYDDNKYSMDGKVYDIEEDYYSGHDNTSSSEKPAWCKVFEERNSIAKAVFDRSFANFCPANIACWFYECYNLKSIEGISNWNTSKAKNMLRVFSYCRKLSNIDLTHFDTSEAVDMDGMFMCCNSLTSLDVGNFKTANVANMHGMFDYCTSLRSLDLKSFNTAKVTDMESMFSDCESLQTLDISSFNTSNVTKMSYMFSGCNSLQTLSVSNFNTSNVKRMYGMFSDCRLIPSLDVSSFDTRNVTDMGCMFDGCYALKKLDLRSFNTAKVTTMDHMFMDCKSLTKLDVSSFDTEKVEYMYYMFYNCESLSELSVSNFNVAKTKRMDSMFQGCSALKSLDLSNFNTANVSNMGDMFSGCSALKSLDLGNFNAANVSGMSSMFKNCYSLTSIDLSSFVTPNLVYLSEMFYGCSQLKTIYASDGWNTDNASQYSVNNLFYGCTSLVGGKGTKFDADHTDYTYAHIDGGKSNPGYFTYKAASKKGDVNRDGTVDVADIATIIDVMAGSATGTAQGADVNGDGAVDVADIAEVISIMAERARLAAAALEE